MSIIFKDIISAFDEALHFYDRGGYDVLPFGNDTFRIIILFIWIGSVFAMFSSYYNNRYLGGFVEKLILSGADEKQKAKTLSELGLSKKRMLKYSLREGSVLRKCVLAQNDPLPVTSVFYKGIGTEGEGNIRAEAEADTVLNQAEITKNSETQAKDKKEKEDIDTLAFYIPKELLAKAETRYRKKGNGLGFIILAIFGTAVAGFILAVYTPLILGFVDNAFSL